MNNTLVIAFIVISGFTSLVGAAFRVMHWPLGNEIMWIGLGLVAVGAVGWIFGKSNSKGNQDGQ